MTRIEWDFDELANPDLVNYIVRAWYPGGDPELTFDQSQTIPKGTKVADFNISQHPTKDRGIYYTVTTVKNTGQQTISTTAETTVPKISLPLPAATNLRATFIP